MLDHDREELAHEALEAADVLVPVNPYGLADGLGFKVLRTDGCHGLCFDVTRVILVGTEVRAERRGFSVCHELGHYLQRRAGIADTEAGANYLASALLLPRLEFGHDLRREGWDLLALKARHAHASWEAIARRIVALREARAFVFDQPRGAEGYWYSVPWGLSPTDVEREAADVARDTGAPYEPVAGVCGWPVVQHDWTRVIVVRAL